MLLVFVTVAATLAPLLAAAAPDGPRAGSGSSCSSDELAVYRVFLDTHWSRELFPKQYPEWRPPAGWSKLVGRTHDASYWLFREGEQASSGLQVFAEKGHSDGLEAADHAGVYDEFTAPPVARGVGRTAADFFLDGNHSMVSVAVRVVPSPDWFIGVDSLDLCRGNHWIDSIAIEVDPMDAGTDNGFTFTAPNWPSEPKEPVARITSKRPSHPANSFFYPKLDKLPSIATFTFVKWRLRDALNCSAPRPPLPLARPSTEAPEESAEEASAGQTGPGTAVDSDMPATTSITGVTLEQAPVDNGTTPRPGQASFTTTTTAVVVEAGRGRREAPLGPEAKARSTTVSPAELGEGAAEATAGAGAGATTSPALGSTTEANSGLTTAPTKSSTSNLTTRLAESFTTRPTTTSTTKLTSSTIDKPNSTSTTSPTMATPGSTRGAVRSTTTDPVRGATLAFRSREPSTTATAPSSSQPTTGAGGRGPTSTQRSVAHLCPPPDQIPSLTPTFAQTEIDDIDDELEERVYHLSMELSRVNASREANEISNELAPGLADVSESVVRRTTKARRSRKGSRQAKHCQVSEWSPWSACSVSCGVGDATRTRRVLEHPRRGGRPCPALQERRWCGGHSECPQNFFNW